MEGPTDLAILQGFARRLCHQDVIEAPACPSVRYCGNRTRSAPGLFHGLAEAAPNLKAMAPFDRMETPLRRETRLPSPTRRQRGIENCFRSLPAPESRARAPLAGEGPEEPSEASRARTMRAAVGKIPAAFITSGKGSPWDGNTKVSDGFPIPLLESRFGKPNLSRIVKDNDLHELADHAPDPEIREKPDTIAQVARGAEPV